MVTIVDVAAQAGVSVATVSRVLNNSYAVTQEKKNLVMEAIEKTGYVIPSRMKIINPNGNKSNILVITSVFISFMLEAIQDTAQASGNQVITYCYRNKNDILELEKLIESLESSLAGIILINAVDDSKQFQELISKYPLVQIGSPIMEGTNNHSVYSDEISMAYDATSYLLKEGKKNIGIIAIEPNSSNLFMTQNREKGYYLALMDNNQDIDRGKRMYADITLEGGYDATLHLLKKYPDMEAIICTCDAIASGCLYAIQTHPEFKHVQPFSLDYNDLWEITKPFLPYIDPQHGKIGAASMEFLSSLINNETISDCRRIIPHEIVTQAIRQNE